MRNWRCPELNLTLIDDATELDAKRAIEQGSKLATALSEKRHGSEY